MAEVDNSINENAKSKVSSNRLPVTVSKPIPYTFDLGHLLCTDANPLPPDTMLTQADLDAAARDCAQVLINQLLSTCPITKSSDQTSMTLALPGTTTPLPREKPVPRPKPLSKWQEFAKRKGIKAKPREGKTVYDEEKGEWVAKYGYKGRNKDGEGDWLVEVDEKKERKEGVPGDARKERRDERKERVRRQERRERANERRAAKK